MSPPRARINNDELVRLYEKTGSLVKAAQLLGVTDRTLNRRRLEDPDLSRRLAEAKERWRANHLPHGASRYRRGCRCPVCTAGNTAKQRDYQARVKTRPEGEQ